MLRWEQHFSMQYSVESRTTFSDEIDLIEYLYSLPAEFKIRSGWSKLLLCKAMVGKLPQDVLS
jgi:asparagine synthase (glutamine-hydrolysing)